MPFYHGLKYYDGDPDYPNKQSWIAGRLLALRRDLYERIGRERAPNSLIIGSWNIRAFDDGTPRLDESYHYIAEIISNFDICAIQEVKTNLAPLKRLVDLLGPNWDYFVNDASTHKGGNNERMAFVYNTNKVFFRHLVGEIVMDEEDLGHDQLIARTPFFAAFQASWFRFTLVSAHIIFGGESDEEKQMRANEIELISKSLLSRARKEDQVYIFLGDMNIDGQDGPLMSALKDAKSGSSKLDVPAFPPTNLNGNRFYDQIAFTTKGKASRKTKLLRHGSFDWRRAVFGRWPGDDFPADPGEGPDRAISDAEHLAHYEPICVAQRAAAGKDPYADFSKSYKTWTSFEMSDHLPIWVELEVDYSDEYLERYVD